MVSVKAISSKAKSRTVFLIIVWGLSALYVLEFYDRGWVPHDEGAIAQSAERVLAGEIPHRDYDEIYTGGLTYLHAAAFKVLGVNLLALRIVLLLFFLAFVPAVYALASKLAPPIEAAAITLLAVAWSVPNYFASVPSWYNLFFATFGTLALSRYVETSQIRWVFLAGFLGGLSILAKITGLYFIAAAILFLTFRERSFDDETVGEQNNSSRIFLSIKIMGVFFFLAALMMVLKWPPSSMEFIYFVIPTAAIGVVLLWQEWRGGNYPLVTRVKILVGLFFPFIIGALIPVTLFVILYLARGSVWDLYRGIFVLPHKRLEFASMDLPPALTVIASLPYAAVLFFPPYRPAGKVERFFGIIVMSLLLVVLSFASNLIVYSIVWQSARVLGVLAVLAGCQVLVFPASHVHLDRTQRQLLFLLVSMTSLISLIQYPFAGPVYFCYTAPFVYLTLLAVMAAQSRFAKVWHCAIMLFYFLFAIVWTNTGYVAAGVGNTGYPGKTLLDIPRGNLHVTKSENYVYTQLVNLVQRHAKSNYIYAAPDCPEVYFLSGKRNPTRNLFDFFSNVERDVDLLRAVLEEKNIDLVVVNREPQFSRRLDEKANALLDEEFAHFVNIGRFTVRWKE